MPCYFTVTFVGSVQLSYIRFPNQFLLRQSTVVLPELHLVNTLQQSHFLGTHLSLYITSKHPLCMERDLPNPNASVCSRTRQLAHLPITFNPQDRIDTAHASVLDRNIETDVLGAPYIHMCIERA
jgi:hypothetical protein